MKGHEVKRSSYHEHMDTQEGVELNAIYFSKINSILSASGGEQISAFYWEMLRS